MNELQLLQNKRAVNQTEMTEIIKKCEEEDRDFNDDEAVIFKTLRREKDKILIEIGAAEQTIKHERGRDHVVLDSNCQRTRSPGSVITGAMDRSYRAMFGEPGSMELSNDGFSSMEEYLQVVNSGLHHPNLIEASAGHSEGIGEDGGFLIPAEFAADLLDASLESEIVRPRANITPMKYKTKTIGGWKSNDHTNNIGGFTGIWMEEAGVNTAQKGKAHAILLTAKKLAIFTMSSNEILEDGGTFENMLGDALIAAMSWYLDLAFLTGTGAGTPSGVLNDPALITVAKESGQVADTIVYENLIKMFARLHPASLKNSVWVTNSTAIPQLLNMAVKIKNVAATENVGGSHIPVMKEDGKGGFQILTRPVVITEKVPAVGSVGDIMLVDFSQYTIGMNKGVVIDKSMHVGFNTDETAHRAILRVDGMGRWSEAVTPKNGDTLSWCVNLAERS